jgi:acyl-CoA reductase-like NAD-dependent aldehyde dehydrogenase
LTADAGTDPALRWDLLVDGKTVSTGLWDAVRSPYSGALVGIVAQGGAAEAVTAVDAAARAMQSPLPAWKRAAILDGVARLLGERREEIARLICAEAGKPIRAAREEVARGIATYTAAATVARTLHGEVVPMDATEAGVGKLAFTRRVPAGVVGAITPFNFPLNLVAHKLAPALAAGCATVLKPAPATPLTALLLAEITAEAGLPHGWLNVVPGRADEIGQVLVTDERVRVITFTGSTEVGWRLRERAPKKRVLLELGSATPLILAEDGDVEAAAEATARHAFSFAGQSCISVQRALVHRSLRAPFLEALLPKVEALVVGDPAGEDTDVGPVVDERSRERILGWIAESRGTVLAGGSLAPGGVLRPTVVADPRPDSRLVCAEVFGPVCTVEQFESDDGAFALANRPPFGLQAAIFTRDLNRALRATEALEYGGVIINAAPSLRIDSAPYGGVKDSGNTREGPAHAARELTEERLVVLASLA